MTEHLDGRSRTPDLALVLWIALALVLVTRLPTWNAPQLDWDEGTRLSIASALNHGRTLYVDAWDHHTFLDILCFQQLFRVFPSAWVPVVVRWGNAAIVVAIALLVYRAVKRFSGSAAWALGATAVCGYLFGRPWALSAYGEFYQSLPVTLAFYLAFGHLGPATRRRLMAIGALFGLAFFTKQTAAIDCAAMITLFILSGRFSEGPSSKRASQECGLDILSAGSGGILPPNGGAGCPGNSQARGPRYILGALARCGAGFLVVALASAAYFAWHGSLREAAYTSFIDPVTYSTGRAPGETLVKYGQALARLCAAGMRVNWLITGLLSVSLALLVAGSKSGVPPSAAARLAWGAGAWLIIDLAGLMLVGRFYDHYLIQLIVPVSIASTFALSRLKQHLQPAACVVLFAVLLLPSVRPLAD